MHAVGRGGPAWEVVNSGQTSAFRGHASRTDPAHTGVTSAGRKAHDGGGGKAGTGSLGKSGGRIPFRSRGLTPRRRGDSARRVRWPEQGETEVRPPRASICLVPPSLASHHHVGKRWCRLAPQAAGGALRPFGKTSGLRAADDRRPRGLGAPADCSSTLPHEAGRWHISCRPGRR
jgi:hypothetical protein